MLRKKSPVTRPGIDPGALTTTLPQATLVLKLIPEEIAKRRTICVHQDLLTYRSVYFRLCEIMAANSDPLNSGPLIIVSTKLLTL